MDTSDFQSINPASFYGKRYKRLGTALDDIASTSQHNVNIVLIPPEVDTLTDEEDINEDECDVRDFPNDVPGEVEVHYDSDDDNIPLSEMIVQANQGPSNLPKKMRTGTEAEPTWSEHKINLEMKETHGYVDRINHVKEQINNKTPVEIFEKLFDNDIFEHIAKQSILYAAQKNNHQFTVTQDDLRIFIAILVLSGYHKLPRERLFWSLDEDVSIPCVSTAMSRNRFQEIKKYLHFADNSKLDKSDKLYKMRPMVTMLNKNFQQWGIFHPHLSIDEAMVKYYGHHSAKQFIRGKPVRFGYKEWMLCSSTGYCYNFDVYCGAKPSCIETEIKAKPTLPLGSRVVLELLECVTEPSDHTVFFDNYFTSYDILKTLREKGFRATGTARDNRIKNCPLPSKSEVNKKERGHFFHMYDKTNNLLFVKWKDNSIVTMATNYDTIEPLSKVKRWSSAQKKKLMYHSPTYFLDITRQWEVSIFLIKA
ncbi:hypothetical protein NQ318_019279 [Aromia moschata]|uniref:PiggyBac transposable element-derived protein domain-containing protein n=1 Tax=Aromia moschata TaxID=1265417 RepID=A0AAV8YYY4_9CUCU|nr:hypothetical protein NQ318_019279 [Aromia moschata]